MGYPIFWSPDAKQDYITILDYQKAANPRLFVSSNKKPLIHRCVLTKQVSLFYRINNQNIELLRFWDNRMNPEKLI